MARHAISRPREDIENDPAVSETDAREAPDTAEAVVETPEDFHDEAPEDTYNTEIPALQTAPRKKGGGIGTLIVIAICGMAIGFIAVMLI